MRATYVVYNDGGYEQQFNTEDEAMADVQRLSRQGIRAAWGRTSDRLIERLEELDDLLTRGPWSASPRHNSRAETQVSIGDYTYTGPAGSGQVRADESDIPTGCLVPFGIIHQDDAEGIAEIRTLLPQIIATLKTGVNK